MFVQGVDGKDERVCLIQPLPVGVGDKYEMHEFLLAPDCDCNLLGREIMAKLEMQINIIRGDIEVNTAVTLLIPG